MLRPSYNDLMNEVNEDVKEGEEPIVNSRYSIVIAAAKRARQIIAGDEPLVESSCGKPLSAAVAELDTGAVKILSGGFDDEAEKVFVTNGTTAINEESLQEEAFMEDEEDSAEKEEEE